MQKFFSVVVYTPLVRIGLSRSADSITSTNSFTTAFKITSRFKTLNSTSRLTKVNEIYKYVKVQVFVKNFKRRQLQYRLWLNPRSWIVVMVTYCFRWCAMNRNAIILHSLQYGCSCDFHGNLSPVYQVLLQIHQNQKILLHSPKPLAANSTQNQKFQSKFQHSNWLG